MAASLYTAPLDSITAEDVDTFLDADIDEGTRLDYKGDTGKGLGISDKLYPVITAFANTSGGIVILGVAKNQHTNGPGKREGLSLNAKIEESITSTCYSVIYPPLTPEVRVCPFKTDPQLSRDDRAFVVVRIAPSSARPHFYQNRLYVRYNSECRDADPMTHRILFEYQQQREQRTEELLNAADGGITAIRSRFIPEWQDPAKKVRWAIGSNRIYIEFVPLDAPDHLFTFWERAPGCQSLDDRVLMAVRNNGWNIQDSNPLDVVYTTDGLGIVATAIQRGSFASVRETEESPVDVIYIDRSGSMALEIATAGLGSIQPSAVEGNRMVFAEQLLKRIARAMNTLWQLYSDEGYAGRVQVYITADTGTSVPSYMLRKSGHRGSTILSVLDDYGERGRRLSTMVNQMIRSWLGFTVSVSSWSGDVPILS